MSLIVAHIAVFKFTFSCTLYSMRKGLTLGITAGVGVMEGKRSNNCFFNLTKTTIVVCNFQHLWDLD